MAANMISAFSINCSEVCGYADISFR